ncbi:MAG: hypothetical protein ACRECH_02685 [Nitrososphaerales archaeon]
MNSSSRNLIAITLGIGFGLVALTILSGGYSVTTFSNRSAQPIGELVNAPAASYATAANQTIGTPNNPNPSLANIGSPTPYHITIIVLAVVSLAIALGASIGVARKVNR